MFKKKILVGHSGDNVQAIFKHIKSSNIPFEIGIKDILKQSSNRFRSKKNDEVYIVFYIIKVRKKYAEQVEAIVGEYVSLENVNHDYKVSKKKSRKLESNEKPSFSFLTLINSLALLTNAIGKNNGTNIVSYISCALLMMTGVFMAAKYYEEMQKESGNLRKITMLGVFIGIGVIVYAVSSFSSLLR
ncbi:hypothetical protein [Lysinibacillus sp. NPDC093692]|uniref:hypothetical protein n=1 Tax=Lysinibacillus sp. NPDC093692 TaxID=3390578 RepID=UPI003D001065